MGQGSGRILVVEDEPLTRRSMVRFLEAEGFSVRQASDVAACRAALNAEPSDIILLDWGLPGPDGLTLARELQHSPDVEVIMITSREGIDERLHALESGVDDYLTKPLHFPELLARIRARLRRKQALRGRTVEVAHLVVHLDERRVTSANEGEISLTRGEFDVFATLIAAQGKIVSREALSAVISRSSPGSRESDPRSVDALISRLRRKLCPNSKDLIATAPGFGYRLNLVP